MEWNRVEINNRSYDLQIRAELPRVDLSSASAMIRSWLRNPSAGHRPWQGLILLAKWPGNSFIMNGEEHWFMVRSCAIRKIKSNCTHWLGENSTEFARSRAPRDPDTEIGLMGLLLRLGRIPKGNKRRMMVIGGWNGAAATAKTEIPSSDQACGGRRVATLGDIQNRRSQWYH